MKTHLAGIDIGEKVFADEKDEAERGERDAHERGEDNGAVPERPIEEAEMAIAEALKDVVEMLVDAPEGTCAAGSFAVRSLLVQLHLGFQQERNHGGDQRSRQKV